MRPPFAKIWFIAVPVFVWGMWALGMTIGEQWHLFENNWFMTLTMCVGSFIAGATSEGGGAVAFPVMTLVFGIEPHVARDFSLLIQSVGMTAASLLIVVFRVRVEWRTVVYASIGGVLGIAIGLHVLSPRLPAPFVKMFFTSLWLSFGLTLFWLNRNPNRTTVDTIQNWSNSDAWSLILVGVCGGMVSGITGSGLDIVTFSMLTLFYRVSEKIATPTSVILMAVNSLVGVSWRQLSTTTMPIDAWNYWAVCVPVVVIGAPAGAYLIQKSTRQKIVALLCASIVAQFLGALAIVPQTRELFAFSFCTMAIGLCAFGLMVKRGRVRVTDSSQSSSELKTSESVGELPSVVPAPKSRATYWQLKQATEK